MPRVDLVVSSKIERSGRVKQLEGMFDVPGKTDISQEWHGDIPLNESPWNVGLVVGSSGCGKSSVARQLFGEEATFVWEKKSVIDDFSKQESIEAISKVCQAVGFNSIPSWMKPFHVLSNGERFRVDLARRLLEAPSPILVDEFSSVVDRQVAKIASHAVQKYIRKENKQFVAVSCHYDILEWLQPDWVLEPATMQFSWRLLQRRPELKCSIGRISHEAWKLFAPFHYLTKDLANSAQCYGLWCDDQLAAFAGVLHRPHPRKTGAWGISRLVTLPDWQGLGLAMRLVAVLGQAHTATRRELRMYPAHPMLIRSFDKSPHWSLEKRPGVFSAKAGARGNGGFGGRPCAVFKYCGPKMEEGLAREFMQI